VLGASVIAAVLGMIVLLLLLRTPQEDRS